MWVFDGGGWGCVRGGWVFEGGVCVVGVVRVFEGGAQVLAVIVWGWVGGDAQVLAVRIRRSGVLLLAVYGRFRLLQQRHYSRRRHLWPTRTLRSVVLHLLAL